MPLRLEPCRQEALTGVAVQHQASHPRFRVGGLCRSRTAAGATALHHRRCNVADCCSHNLGRRKRACRQVVVRSIKALCSTLHPLGALRPRRSPRLLLLLLRARHGCRTRKARALSTSSSCVGGAEGRKALLIRQTRPAHRCSTRAQEFSEQGCTWKHSRWKKTQSTAHKTVLKDRRDCKSEWTGRLVQAASHQSRARTGKQTKATQCIRLAAACRHTNLERDGSNVTILWCLEAKSGDQQASGRKHACAGLSHITSHWCLEAKFGD